MPHQIHNLCKIISKEMQENLSGVDRNIKQIEELAAQYGQLKPESEWKKQPVVDEEEERRRKTSEAEKQKHADEMKKQKDEQDKKKADIQARIEASIEELEADENLPEASKAKLQDLKGLAGRMAGHPNPKELAGEIKDHKTKLRRDRTAAAYGGKVWSRDKKGQFNGPMVAVNN